MGEPQYRLEGIVHTKSDVLEDFEGPLDVIFELLSKNKIEIQDVSISAILEQYLGYLDEMKRMDMEIASEFITMASHLMLIKTKMLLSAAEQAEAESELDLLRQSLVERKRKEAMEQIRQAVVNAPEYEIGKPEIQDCGDFDHAFYAAVAAARPGDTVLMSPASAAFDQFKNFMVRGDHFKKLVMEL